MAIASLATLKFSNSLHQFIVLSLRNEKTKKKVLSLHSNWWQGHFPFELNLYLIKENLTLTTPISSWAGSHAPIKQIRYEKNWESVFDMGCSIAFCSDRA